jgi:hypothetical protein
MNDEKRAALEALRKEPLPNPSDVPLQLWKGHLQDTYPMQQTFHYERHTIRIVAENPVRETVEVYVKQLVIQIVTHRLRGSTFVPRFRQTCIRIWKMVCTCNLCSSFQFATANHYQHDRLITFWKQTDYNSTSGKK